jgi:4-hydroxybenzoate polyprenyltransferase and related prenyltransferases
MVKCLKARTKIKAFLDLLKPELPLAAGICVIAGEIIGLGHVPTVTQLFLGFLVGFTVSGAAMMSNDYFDIEVDRINKPNRPLPSGRISPREVIVFTFIFSVAGFLAAAFLGAVTLVASVIIWAVGILYNWRGKESGVPGNMMVAFSVASTFIFGGLAVGGLASGVVWTFGGLAFLFDLAEEIANGAMDAEGDRLRSNKSLSLLKGPKFAIHVSGLLFAFFICLSLVPFAAGWLGYSYLAVMLAADLLVAFFVSRLVRVGGSAGGRNLTRWLYLTLTTTVVTIVIIRLFG